MTDHSRVNQVLSEVILTIEVCEEALEALPDDVVLERAMEGVRSALFNLELLQVRMDREKVQADSEVRAP